MDWKPQAPLGYWWGTPRVQGAARGRQALQDARATNSPVDARRVGQHRRREQKLWWYAMLLPHGTGEVLGGAQHREDGGRRLPRASLENSTRGERGWRSRGWGCVPVLGGSAPASTRLRSERAISIGKQTRRPRSGAERCAGPHLRAVGSAVCASRRARGSERRLQLLSGGPSCQQPAARSW